MTERRYCVRRSEIIKGVANKKATVFAEDALVFSKCQLEKCHFMCTMGYYCTNSCTITLWVRRAGYFHLTAIILEQTQITGTQKCGSKVMALWKCRLKKKESMLQALASWKVICTMSALCGLETSSLSNGETHTSFHHLKYNLYTVVVLGNMKRLCRIYISFSYLLWYWNICSPHALANEFVHFLLLCYQLSDVTIIWCTLLSALVWLWLTLVNGIKGSSPSDLVQDMSLGAYYLHFFVGVLFGILFCIFCLKLYWIQI